jgi:hypothetical protein
VKIMSEPNGQTIQLSIENWRSAFNDPSNRTYLNQKDYDSADTSAAASIAASNGLRRDTGAGTSPGVAPGSPAGYGGSGTGSVGSMSGGSYGSYPDGETVYNEPSYLGTNQA